MTKKDTGRSFMDRRIRVLYVQPFNRQSGPHQSLKTLLGKLDGNRYCPHVLLPAQSPIVEDFISLGAKVDFDQQIRTIPRSLSPTGQVKFWAGAVKSASRLVKRIDDGKFQIVHVNSEACWTAGFAARRARKVIVYHLHGMSVLSPAWVGRLTAAILNRFDGLLIAVSNEVKQAYVARGTRERSIKVIHNGLDVSIFNPDKAKPKLRSELKVEDGMPLIGMVANFDPRKGHHYFVKACALISKQKASARFVIVGAGETHRSYFRQIKEMVVSCGLSESFHILGLRRDVPDILASLDVVVQPSQSEAGPIVPIEAMAMERPIVVSDAGGNPEEVLHEQTGLVVPVGDVNGMALAITRLISEPHLGKRLGKAGRRRVLDLFRDDIYARKVEEVYEEAMDQHSSRH